MLATAKFNIAFRLGSACDSESVVDIDGRETASDPVRKMHSSDHRWGLDKG